MITTFLKQQAIAHHRNQGVIICPVKDANSGINLTKDLLYHVVDKRTILYLSGGKTPKNLYTQLAQEGTLLPGAVGLVDERYGKKFHPNSNEKMISETELLRYLTIRGIPFYPLLQSEKSREETAELYDQKMRELTTIFPKSIAIMGLGSDGHTSGIAPNRKNFTNPMFDTSQKNLFVSEFDDPKSAYGERVGMTFLGLTMQDLLIVLVFGEDKKKALASMFESGSEQEIPARFYTRPEIAQKTLIITDQIF